MLELSVVVSAVARGTVAAHSGIVKEFVCAVRTVFVILFYILGATVRLILIILLYVGRLIVLSAVLCVFLVY